MPTWILQYQTRNEEERGIALTELAHLRRDPGLSNNQVNEVSTDSGVEVTVEFREYPEDSRTRQILESRGMLVNQGLSGFTSMWAPLQTSRITPTETPLLSELQVVSHENPDQSPATIQVQENIDRLFVPSIESNPSRSEVILLGPDTPREPLGWTSRERIGLGIINPRAVRDRNPVRDSIEVIVYRSRFERILNEDG